MRTRVSTSWGTTRLTWISKVLLGRFFVCSSLKCRSEAILCRPQNFDVFLHYRSQPGRKHQHTQATSIIILWPRKKFVEGNVICYCSVWLWNVPGYSGGKASSRTEVLTSIKKVCIKTGLTDDKWIYQSGKEKPYVGQLVWEQSRLWVPLLGYWTQLRFWSWTGSAWTPGFVIY